MSDTHETIADIIAEMRKSDCDKICPWWADGGSCDLCPLGRNGKNCSFSNYADRLDAALKRERGDCAKLREALTRILNLTNSLDENCAVDPVEIRDIAKAALAAPPRNCDVGTAQKQSRRFEEYCESEVCKRNRCKSQAKALCIERCALAWAQMPYEEGGAK